MAASAALTIRYRGCRSPRAYLPSIRLRRQPAGCSSIGCPFHPCGYPSIRRCTSHPLCSRRYRSHAALHSFSALRISLYCSSPPQSFVRWLPREAPADYTGTVRFDPRKRFVLAEYCEPQNHACCFETLNRLSASIQIAHWV